MRTALVLLGLLVGCSDESEKTNPEHTSSAGRGGAPATGGTEQHGHAGAGRGGAATGGVVEAGGGNGAGGGIAAGGAEPAGGEGGSATQRVKGMFELVADDFERHGSFGVGAPAVLPSVSGALPQTIAGGWLDTGIALARGDLLLLEASGEISSETLPGSAPATVDPEGHYGWLGGVSYLLTNRTALALHGRVGDTVFLIGSGTVLLAPATGTLELAANTCAGCSTVGAFDVLVHTELNPDVQLAETPAIEDNTVLDSSDLELDAGGGWLKTGLTVKRGEKLFFDATGSFTVEGSLPGTYDANGARGWIGGNSFLISSAPAHRLFARFGSRIVELGTSAALLAPRSAELELGINADGSVTPGSPLTVTVGRGVRPARGLESSWVDEAESAPPLVLDLDDDWSGVGLELERGSPLIVSASGEISGSRIDWVTDSGAVGPEGLGAMGGTPFRVSSRPAFAVFGRIGSQEFYLGAENVLLAPARGSLEVAINAVRCDECQDCRAPSVLDPANCVDCSLCGEYSGSYTVSSGAVGTLASGTAGAGN